MISFSVDLTNIQAMLKVAIFVKFQTYHSYQPIISNITVQLNKRTINVSDVRVESHQSNIPILSSVTIPSVDNAGNTLLPVVSL